MRYILLSLAGALSLAPALHAQTWSGQTSGTTLNLLSIAAINATTAFAVGQNGLGFKTTNGGTTWAAMNTGTTEDINSVRFLNASTGFTFGGGQEVRITTNGGTSWGQVSGGTTTLHDGFVPSLSHVWVVGDVEAGYGFLYNPMTFNFPFVTAAANRSLRGIYFSSTSTGWVVGQGGVILNTTDFGINWQAQTSGVTQTLESVMFSSATDGVAVGDGGTILRTTNGGTTWQAVLSGTGNDLKSVYFADASNVWAVGDAGTILHSADAGATWSLESSGTTVALQGIHGSGTGSIWTVGDDGTILTRGTVTSRPAAVALPEAAVYPQPAREAAYLQLPAPLAASSGTVVLTNALGEVVSKYVLEQGSATVLLREGLPSGMYFYSVSRQGQEIAKGKVLFE